MCIRDRAWTPYPFRYKPQALDSGGAIYAPYQPRFEWNLWFASLGSPRNNAWVRSTAERLVDGAPSVLALFREDPFHGQPPRAVRAVRWQYWYTTPAEMCIRDSLLTDPANCGYCGGTCLPGQACADGNCV